MKRPLLLLLCSVLIAACGGNGENGEGEEPPEPTPDTATFRSDEIAFTFEYPREFTARRRRQGDVLGQVSVGSGGPLNAITVRRTSDRELERDRYLDEFARDFERRGAAVEQREERIGDLDVGVLELERTAQVRGRETTITSSLYFFTGGGGTWQVECVSDEERRDLIADACTTALESVDFRDAE